jgi:hypothetical protein
VNHEDIGKLKLDLGCGAKKKDGFLGVDVRKFAAVDVVADLTQPWPWPNWSVGEVFCSHFVEHLDAAERIHFANELYRVLMPGGRATLITPHWASTRAYGDLTHKWPPVAESWYPHLNRRWRQENAPHGDAYDCDFDHSFDYGVSDALAARPTAEQHFAILNYKEAAQDLIAKLVRR